MKEPNKLPKWLEVILKFMSTPLFIVSTIVDIVDFGDLISNISRYVMIGSAIAVLCYFAYLRGYIVQTLRANIKSLSANNDNQQSELSKLKAKVNLLELNINDGMKVISNNAQVTFNTDEKVYKLEFNKVFEVLNPYLTWYPAQFYCNKALEDSEKSREYYEKNPVKIEMVASLTYRNPDAERFSKKYSLEILTVSDGQNYKQYHLQFKTKAGDKLDIHQGAIINLRYSYCVDAAYWGSYLNRSVSYFAEDAQVILRCKNSDCLTASNIKLFELRGNGGEPVLIPTEESQDQDNDGYTFIRIMLPKEEFGKFRIHWDSSKLFGKGFPQSANVADTSQLTKY